MKPIRRISFTCKFHSSCTTNESGCKIFASPDLSRHWNAWFWRSNKKRNMKKDLPHSKLSWAHHTSSIHPEGYPWAFFFHQWHNMIFFILFFNLSQISDVYKKLPKQYLFWMLYWKFAHHAENWFTHTDWNENAGCL